MAVQVHNIVSGDESDVHDEPHVEGSRVTVRHINARVEGRGLHPKTVADRLNLDRADVYAALSYYHNNPEEMRRIERRREEISREIEDETTLTPPE